MYLSDSDKQKIIEACHKNDISFCALFGSFARGEATGKSDIDLLVRFSKPIGWAFYGIAEDLETALGRKVDLATENMLGKRIRENVMHDLQVIYEKPNNADRLRHILDAIERLENICSVTIGRVLKRTKKRRMPLFVNLKSSAKRQRI